MIEPLTIQRDTPRWQRVLSCALAVTLIATSWPSPEAFAAGSVTAVPLTRSSMGPVDLAHLDLSALALPPELGDIVERWQPVGVAPRALIVHLQDLHTHPEAQRHIAALIGELRAKLGIELVMVEGADGPCDISPYTELPDSSATERIAQLFLEQGLFTGAEYYAITHPHTVTLWGAEETATYLEHLRTYQQGVASSADASAIVQQLRARLAPLRATIYPPTLRQLITLHEGYEHSGDEQAFRSYVEELRRLAQTSKLDLNLYPHIELYHRSEQLYAHLDLRAVELDRVRLFHTLARQLSPSEQRELMPEGGVAITRHPSEERDERLAALAVQHRLLDLSVEPDASAFSATGFLLALMRGLPAHENRFRAFRQYLAYGTLTKQLHSSLLRHELETLEDAVQEASFTTDQQRALRRVWNTCRILDELIHAQLSPEHYQSYQQHREAFTADAIWRALGMVGHRITEGSLTRQQLNALIEQLPTFERFYTLAAHRNDIFVANTLHQLEQGNRSSAILVTGGFHTPGITQQLRDRQIAYLVISPTVSTKLNEEQYRARLENTAPTMEQLLQQLNRQTLVPVLRTGTIASQLPADSRGASFVSSSVRAADAAAGRTLKNVTLFLFVGLWAYLFLRHTGANGVHQLLAWIQTHTDSGLSLVQTDGRIALSALGDQVDFHVVSSGAIALAMANQGERNRPLHVLVVDDEEFHLLPMTEILADSYGSRLSVSVARSGAEAQQRLQTEPVDVMISDFHMPGPDGAELASWARRHVGSPLPIAMWYTRDFDGGERGRQQIQARLTRLQQIDGIDLSDIRFIARPEVGEGVLVLRERLRSIIDPLLGSSSDTTATTHDDETKAANALRALMAGGVAGVLTSVTLAGVVAVTELIGVVPAMLLAAVVGLIGVPITVNFLTAGAWIIRAFVHGGGIRGPDGRFHLRDLLVTPTATPQGEHSAFSFLPQRLQDSIRYHETQHARWGEIGAHVFQSLQLPFITLLALPPIGYVMVGAGFFAAGFDVAMMGGSRGAYDYSALGIIGLIAGAALAYFHEPIKARLERIFEKMWPHASDAPTENGEQTTDHMSPDSAWEVLVRQLELNAALLKPGSTYRRISLSDEEWAIGEMFHQTQVGVRRMLARMDRQRQQGQRPTTGVEDAYRTYVVWSAYRLLHERLHDLFFGLSEEQWAAFMELVPGAVQTLSEDLKQDAQHRNRSVLLSQLTRDEFLRLLSDPAERATATRMLVLASEVFAKVAARWLISRTPGVIDDPFVAQYPDAFIQPFIGFFTDIQLRSQIPSHAATPRNPQQGSSVAPLLGGLALGLLSVLLGLHGAWATEGHFPVIPPTSGNIVLNGVWVVALGVGLALLSVVVLVRAWTWLRSNREPQGRAMTPQASQTVRWRLAAIRRRLAEIEQGIGTSATMALQQEAMNGLARFFEELEAIYYSAPRMGSAVAEEALLGLSRISLLLPLLMNRQRHELEVLQSAMAGRVVGFPLEAWLDQLVRLQQRLGPKFMWVSTQEEMRAARLERDRLRIFLLWTIGLLGVMALLAYVAPYVHIGHVPGRLPLPSSSDIIRRLPTNPHQRLLLASATALLPPFITGMVRQLSPSSTGDMVSDEQDAGRKIAERVLPLLPRTHPEGQPLTVYSPIYYPSRPSEAVVHAVMSTDADRYIFVDPHGEFAPQELQATFEAIEARLKQTGTAVGMTQRDPTTAVFTFQLAGPDGQLRPRELIYYAGKDARLFTPTEVATTYDILYVEDSPFSLIWGSLFKPLETLRSGGYVVLVHTDNLRAIKDSSRVAVQTITENVNDHRRYLEGGERTLAEQIGHGLLVARYDAAPVLALKPGQIPSGSSANEQDIQRTITQLLHTTATARTQAWNQVAQWLSERLGHDSLSRRQSARRVIGAIRQRLLDEADHAVWSGLLSEALTGPDEQARWMACLIVAPLDGTTLQSLRPAFERLAASSTDSTEQLWARALLDRIEGRATAILPETSLVPVSVDETYEPLADPPQPFIVEQGGQIWMPTARNPIHPGVISRMHGRSTYGVPSVPALAQGALSTVVKGAAIHTGSAKDGVAGWDYDAETPIETRQFRGGERRGYVNHAVSTVWLLRDAYAQAQQLGDPVLRETHATRVPVLRPRYLVRPLALPIPDQQVPHGVRLAPTTEVLTQAGVPEAVQQEQVQFIYQVRLPHRVLEANERATEFTPEELLARIAAVYGYDGQPLTEEIRTRISIRFADELALLLHLVHDYVDGTLTTRYGCAFSPQNVTVSGEVVDLDSSQYGISRVSAALQPTLGRLFPDEKRHDIEQAKESISMMAHVLGVSPQPALTRLWEVQELGRRWLAKEGEFSSKSSIDATSSSGVISVTSSDTSAHTPAAQSPIPETPRHSGIEALAHRRGTWTRVVTYANGTVERVNNHDEVIWATVKSPVGDLDVIRGTEANLYEVWLGRTRIDESFGFEWAIVPAGQARGATGEPTLQIDALYLNRQGEGVGRALVDWLTQHAARRHVTRGENHATTNPDVVQLLFPFLESSSVTLETLERGDWTPVEPRREFLERMRKIDVIEGVGARARTHHLLIGSHRAVTFHDDRGRQWRVAKADGASVEVRHPDGRRFLIQFVGDALGDVSVRVVNAADGTALRRAYSKSVRISGRLKLIDIVPVTSSTPVVIEKNVVVTAPEDTLQSPPSADLEATTALVTRLWKHHAVDLSASDGAAFHLSYVQNDDGKGTIRHLLLLTDTNGHQQARAEMVLQGDRVVMEHAWGDAEGPAILVNSSFSARYDRVGTSLMRLLLELACHTGAKEFWVYQVGAAPDFYRHVGLRETTHMVQGDYGLQPEPAFFATLPDDQARWAPIGIVPHPRSQQEPEQPTSGVDVAPAPAAVPQLVDVTAVRRRHEVYSDQIGQFVNLTPDRFTTHFTAWLTEQRGHPPTLNEQDEIARFAAFLSPAPQGALVSLLDKQFREEPSFPMAKCMTCAPLSAALTAPHFPTWLVTRVDVPPRVTPYKEQAHQYVEVLIAGESVIVDLTAGQYVPNRSLGIVAVPKALIERPEYRERYPWYTTWTEYERVPISGVEAIGQRTDSKSVRQRTISRIREQAAVLNARLNDGPGEADPVTYLGELIQQGQGTLAELDAMLEDIIGRGNPLDEERVRHLLQDHDLSFVRHLQETQQQVRQGGSPAARAAVLHEGIELAKGSLYWFFGMLTSVEQTWGVETSVPDPTKTSSRTAQAPTAEPEPSMVVSGISSLPMTTAEAAHQALQELVTGKLVEVTGRPVVVRIDGAPGVGKTEIAKWLEAGGAGLDFRQVSIADDSAFVNFPSETVNTSEAIAHKKAGELLASLPDRYQHGQRLVVVCAFAGFRFIPDERADLILRVTADRVVQEQRLRGRLTQLPNSAALTAKVTTLLAGHRVDLAIDTTTIPASAWAATERDVKIPLDGKPVPSSTRVGPNTAPAPTHSEKK